MCVTICVYIYGVCVGAYLNIATCWVLGITFKPVAGYSEIKLLYIYIHTHICVFTVLLSPLFVCDYLFA